MITVIVAIIVFTLIIVGHEFGHFIMAKLSGIKVVEFAVGMGPKVVGKQYGETLFSIRALPIGGMCQMLGEDESNENPRAFNSKPVYKRMAVIVFGPLMNLIIAVLLFSFVVAQVPVIENVVQGKPAQAAGIKSGEKIIAINGTDITKLDDVNTLISANSGKNVTIKLEKDGITRDVNVVPVVDPSIQRSIIGVEMRAEFKISGFSLTEGAKITGDITAEMFKFLGKLFTGKASANDVSGPVGIVVYMNQAAKAGLINVVFFTAVLSLNLAIINLLPLPALDGGRLLFLFIEAIRRKPLNPEKEGLVHFVGFVMLMALSILLIYKDIMNLV